MNLFIHKLKKWEYWPSWIIYLPAFLFWVLMALRFRSFRFYKWANPILPNGGLFDDPKSQLYQLFPSWVLPATQLWDTKKNPGKMPRTKIPFPCILKPDIGARGKGVVLVQNQHQANAIIKQNQGNFLIQEYIAYPHELGLFYYRLPNQSEGKITGLTLKQFMQVNGNGFDTIRKIMLQNPRFAMQIGAIENQINLEQIPAAGETVLLMPIGNHNRGTIFLNGYSEINSEFTQSMNRIFSSIEGLNYGRFDIRYKSIEDLKQGLNFKILEFNGAKSEPTHIYDPSQNFFQAQKEIFRHQFLLFKLVKANRAKEKRASI